MISISSTPGKTRAGILTHLAYHFYLRLAQFHSQYFQIVGYFFLYFAHYKLHGLKLRIIKLKLLFH